ncbi:MAG: glycosyltransferase family 39 protein [Acidobacteria bacterium]|nr:glycosyltransferase family 39 protein [Acidobacteriota bacterium]
MRLVTFIGPGIALYFLLFHGLADVSFLSADEPRYAAIGREMAQSGDWVTPRLNGEAWFEKPPLLYWMTAAAWKWGLRDESAARFPVALVSAGFLLFFYWWLRREFGHGPAFQSASILATTVGWVVYSNVAVTDIPLAVTFGAAMLLAMPTSGGARTLPWGVGVLLGLAMLAKGLVPAVLALPLVYFHRGQWRRLVMIGVIAAAVALPWMLLATARNGGLPFEELILKHHFARFFGGEIHHERPVWFYVPVLLGGLLPWTPALVALRPRAREAMGWQDERLRYFAAWAGFGFVFFSASTNKLPGYLLPILPAVAALIGLRLTWTRPLRVAVGAMLPLLVLGAAMLPEALEDGLGRAPLRWGNFAWMAGAAVLGSFCTPAAVAGLALWAKLTVYPVLDQHLGARKVWEEIRPKAAATCVEWIGRDWQYGLDYYAVPRLPSCTEEPREWELVGEGGARPGLRKKSALPE